MAIVRPPYPPVGRCIYCGATRHSVFREKLGDEHIIPEGIGGTYVLPKASCGKCEAITGTVEQYCQRPMLGALRYKLGLPSKRPKDRPKTLSARLLINGEWREQALPIDDYPLVLFAPIFPPPGILAHPNQPAYDQPLQFFCMDTSSEEKRQEILKQHGATHIVADSRTRVDMFGRMLAKIAHAYATASYGIGNFKPLLLETIFGTADDPTFYVGGETTRPDSTERLHKLDIGHRMKYDKKLLVVRVHLFASGLFPTFDARA